MKAVIFFSNSKHQRSRAISEQYEGDKFEIVNIGRQVKFIPFQMIYYGYLTVFNRPVQTAYPEIEFNKYDEITLVSPIWAGRVNIFMKQFLENNEIKNKNIRIVGSCDGGYNKYFSSYTDLIDSSNTIIEEVIYVKDKRV